ncbi:RNA-binding protein, CCR4-NOT complex subunit Rcd1, partial [Coemansia spiralis]
MNSGGAAGGLNTTLGFTTQSYFTAQQQQQQQTSLAQAADAVKQHQALSARLHALPSSMASTASALYGMAPNGGGGGGSAGTDSGGGAGDGGAGGDSEGLYQLMVELFSATNREQALAELSRRRDQNPDLGVALWNAYGVMTILYQEIIAIYPLLNPPALTMLVSNRVCNSLALLQLVATHEATRMQLLKANVPQLLYPFLSTTSKVKQYDNLRLTSLG